MKTAEEYEDQLAKMAVNARKWRVDHPDSSVLVTFNYPASITVIGTISNAIRNNFVSANEDGLKWIKSVWPWGREDEPTVLMVRAVLEHWQEHP